MADYVALCSGALKKQPLPMALKAAFKKYGVFIPEMEEAGAVQRCANCGALPSPEVKLLSCPCKDVKYCSKACQKAHWKTHKPSCPTTIAATAAGGGPSRPATGSSFFGSGSRSSTGQRRAGLPSEASVAAAMRALMASGGKMDSSKLMCPMPGCEAAEAWKECLRRMIKSSALTSSTDTSGTEVLQAALREYEAREAEFYKVYPDAPKWAEE